MPQNNYRIECPTIPEVLQLWLSGTPISGIARTVRTVACGSTNRSHDTNQGISCGRRVAGSDRPTNQRMRQEFMKGFSTGRMANVMAKKNPLIDTHGE